MSGVYALTTFSDVLKEYGHVPALVYDLDHAALFVSIGNGKDRTSCNVGYPHACGGTLHAHDCGLETIAEHGMPNTIRSLTKERNW